MYMGTMSGRIGLKGISRLELSRPVQFNSYFEDTMTGREGGMSLLEANDQLGNSNPALSS